MLGYWFADRGLLKEALTHRSASGVHNERLEFIGDAFLNAVIAAELYERCPKATEGALTRLRASLVNREALAAVARRLGLGDYLRLGPGELKSGGFRRDSLLADALEALIGAIYLDGGFERCAQHVTLLFRDEVDAAIRAAPQKDPKTRLQEWLQARNLPLPFYQTASVAGEPHAQSFRVQCGVEALGHSAFGEGTTRRRAEQQAARRMLELLQRG